MADKLEPVEVVVLQQWAEEVLQVLYMWIAWFQCYRNRYDLSEPDELSNSAAAVADQPVFALP